MKKREHTLSIILAALLAAVILLPAAGCTHGDSGPLPTCTPGSDGSELKDRSEDNRVMDMIMWYDNDNSPATNDRPEKGWYYLNPDHPNTVTVKGLYRATNPLLGLYDQRKPATARQHLYWISAVGCNAICVDWTNYTSYRTAADSGWKKYTVGTYLNGQNLLKTASETTGFDVPKIYFAARLFGENYDRLRDVLDDLYSLYEKYPDVWYRFDDGTADAAKPFLEIFIDWNLQSRLRAGDTLYEDSRWNIRFTNGLMSESTDVDKYGNRAVPANIPVWLFVENEEDNAAGEGMYRTFYSVGADGRVEQMVAWASIHKGGLNWDPLNHVVNGRTTFERSLRNVRELSPKALIVARWNYPLCWLEEPQEGLSLYESTHIEPNTDFGFAVFDNVKTNLYSLNNWRASAPPRPAITENADGRLLLATEGFPTEYRLAAASGEGDWIYYNINDGVPTDGLTAGTTYHLQTRNSFGESETLEFVFEGAQ